eukprot:Skav214693  [mRNA]  locus=scaffold1127:10211:11569:- [translate_table: standard]
MDRQDGLTLLHLLEELNVAPAVSPEVRAWWKKHYPNVSEEVLDYMKGQDQSWKGCGNLPWNRHLRRRCETSKMGVILHLFAGNQAMCKKWKDLEQLGYVVLTMDIANNNLENLHNAALWSYVSWLCQSGKLRILLGGPPCRTFSRLRHRRPGPRPLRGGGTLRWRLPNLTPKELDEVYGDAALVLKMYGLYDMMVEGVGDRSQLAFLMEHLRDVVEYIEGEEVPSVWEWEETLAFQKRHDLKLIRLDQGCTGHVRKKPTTLMISLPGMEQLDGLVQEEHRADPLPSTLAMRMHQSSSWSMWSPGLVEAIKTAIRDFAVGSTSKVDSNANQLKRMSMDEWRQHVRQNHVPFRRDCRLCVEEMGQDLPHRRRHHRGGESVYVLSVDIVGPFVKGWDIATGHDARYALLATVPVPLGARGEPTEAEARDLLGHAKGDDVGLHAAKDDGPNECPHD